MHQLYPKTQHQIIMKVLTVIISYNFTRWIQPCLNSLIQSEVPTDILVIDNGSSDNCIKTIKEEFPKVRIIENEKNLGFGQANNIGINIAIKEQYDYVLLLNQDAWIDQNVIGELTDLSNKFNDFGIITSVHLVGDRSTVDSGSPGCYVSKEDAESPIIETPFVNAAIWLIPTRVLKEVGGFSPLFFHYGEDVDYANRIHYHGYKIGYCPYVCGCHDRAKRTTTNAMRHRATAVYCLTLFSNIHFPLYKAFFKSIKCCLHHSAKSLFKADWEGCFYFIKVLFKLLANTKRVDQIRRLCKVKGSHFIYTPLEAYKIIT